jgi:hypothetical protein
MPTSAIDSLTFRDIFGDPEVRAIWPDENRTNAIWISKRRLPMLRRPSA